MDKETLQKHLQALASGKESTNTPLVEAYLADEYAAAVASPLSKATDHHQSKTPLLPPSSCLPMLD